jgi:cytochrome P450
MSTDDGDIELYDPDRYVAGAPHDTFARARSNHGVFYQTTPDGGGYWAVLRHADVIEVSRNPEVFSASLGGVVIEDLDAQSLEMMRNMLLAMDPPRHIDHRKNVSPHFRAKVIAGLEPRIREICREVIADAINSDVDFVHDVAARLPAQVMGELMGLPRADWAKIHALSARNTGSQDPDINPDEAETGTSASVEMAMYAIEFAQQRRSDPGEDLTSLILASQVDGEEMTDIAFGSFFVQLVTAGNDTTRTMLSSGLHALLTHDDQFAALRRDPSAIPRALEEMLRWANPLHYFRRTATTDTTIGDQEIAAGDKVVMYYTAANRDPAVFEDPNRFDITRHPNPHLSFGIGEHFCLGVHLARLEGRVFFEELINATTSIDLIGEPARQRSNLNNALKSLPVRLHA